MCLDFFDHTQDFTDLIIQRRFSAEENVAIRMGSIIAIINKILVGADFTIVAGNQFEKTHDTTFVYDAVDKVVRLPPLVISRYFFQNQ